MAAEIDKLTEQFKATHPEVAASLHAIAQVARKLGAPEHFNKGVIAAEILDQEWVRQANNLADLFASELGQSREQYIDGLPRFTHQPESYRGRFDIPLIVQTPSKGLTLASMLEIVGIVNYLELNRITDWEEDPQGFITPGKPYTTWLHDGSRNKERSVTFVRESLMADERGGTVHDGISLFVQNPHILKDHYLDLSGSQYGSDGAPLLRLWYGRPGLNYSWIDDASLGWGSVVAGREIKLK